MKQYIQCLIVVSVLALLTTVSPTTPATHSVRPIESTPSIQLNEQVEAKAKPAAPIPPAATIRDISTPTKPAAWQVTTPVGGVPTETINTALQTLQNLGLTKEGAAYLTGNFIQESRLDPGNCTPDGDLACGIAQWHPGRRADMPAGLVPQLEWAFNTEMKRDTPYLRDALMNPESDLYGIKQAIKRWERWGVLGNRWQYGADILNQLK